MNSQLMSFSFKSIFKSRFCWSTLIITTVVFFISSFGIMHLCASNIDYGDVKRIDKVDIRLWMSFFTYFILSISLSNLSKFVIDRQNLIFVISKHYERLKVLLVKMFVFFFFALIYVLALSIGAHVLNLYARKTFHVALWASNKAFFMNFCLQILLLTIYNILFWSTISLYASQKYYIILITFFQFSFIFIHLFMNPILKKILDKEVEYDYVLFVNEKLVNNLFFCPISVVTFTIGISCFYRMDLRI